MIKIQYKYCTYTHKYFFQKPPISKDCLRNRVVLILLFFIFHFGKNCFILPLINTLINTIIKIILSYHLGKNAL